MSTRAHIKITDGFDTFYLYHHHDGYPEGIGNDIKAYLEKIGFFSKPKYCVDQYPSAISIVNGIMKGIFSSLYESVDNSYELTTCFHGDEEFCYLIDCTKRELHCFHVGWGGPDLWNPNHEVKIKKLEK